MSSKDLSPNRSNLLVMILGVTALLFVLLLVLIAQEPAHLAAAQQQHEAKRLEQGAIVYSLHCLSCHGIRGEGIGQLGPALNDSHFFSGRLKEVGSQSTLLQYVVATIEQGRMMGTRPIYAGNGQTSVMSPWLQRYGGPLRGDEIAAVAAFVLNWRDTALGKVELTQLVLPEPNRQDPQLLDRGKHAFSENCGRCHRFRHAHSDGNGPDLSHIAEEGGTRIPEVSAEDYLRRSVLVPDEFIVPGFEQVSGAESCGAILSTGDLLALCSYLLQ